MDYSSFWKMKVLQTKLMQTLMFDPGGFKVRLRACPFLKTWRALVYGELFVRALDEAAAFFWQMDDSESSSCRRGTGESFTPYVLRSITASPQPG